MVLDKIQLKDGSQIHANTCRYKSYRTTAVTGQYNSPDRALTHKDDKVLSTCPLPESQ